MLTRTFGSPVEPPVPNAWIGFPASPFGTQRRIGPPRATRPRSGLRSFRFGTDLQARDRSGASSPSSQKSQPVPGSKCHATISRAMRVEAVARLGDQPVITPPALTVIFSCPQAPGFCGGGAGAGAGSGAGASFAPFWMAKIFVRLTMYSTPSFATGVV